MMPIVNPTTVKPAIVKSVTINPTPYVMSKEFRDKQSMNKKIGIGIGILVLIGLIMVGRKFPKATIGIIGALLLYVYFFVGFLGPSRYSQWANPTKQKQIRR